MKYIIEWMELKTSTNGNKYIKATLSDDKQMQTSDVAIFSSFPKFDELQPGSSVEGELKEKDYNGRKSYSLEVPRVESGRKPNMDRVMDKKATNIAEAQNRKEQSIHAAQDRSAWMWAKNNAVTLLANKEDWTLQDIHELATKIYNMEPTEPF